MSRDSLVAVGVFLACFFVGFSITYCTPQHPVGVTKCAAETPAFIPTDRIPEPQKGRWM